jgi:hypothetical protein
MTQNNNIIGTAVSILSCILQVSFKKTSWATIACYGKCN